MRKLTQTDEVKLANAVKTATAAVIDGAHPNDAVLKAASEQGLGPGATRAVAHAVNGGLQLAQMEDGKTASSRFASFPVADPEAIIAEGWGSTQKDAAEATDYALCAEALGINAPVVTHHMPMTKAAACCDARLGYIVKATETPVGEARRRRDEAFAAKMAHERDRQALSGGVRKLARLLQADGDPALEAAAVARHGALAGAIWDLAIKEAGWDPRKVKRAAEAKLNRVITADHPVLKAAEECVGMASQARKSRQASQDARNRILAPTMSRAKGAAVLPQLRLKTAGPLDIAFGNVLSSALLGRPMNTTTIQSAKAPSDAKVDELDDPLHDQAMNNVRAQAMLATLMSDPNSPVAAKDPAAVAASFGKMTRLAPRAASQPVIAEPWIKRDLQGHMEPFEAQQVTQVEKTLKDNASAGAA